MSTRNKINISNSIYLKTARAVASPVWDMAYFTVRRNVDYHIYEDLNSEIYLNIRETTRSLEIASTDYFSAYEHY